MTPEQRIKQLEDIVRQQNRAISELLAWKRRREVQQLTYPLDDISKNVLEAPNDSGAGSSGLTQEIELTGEVQSIDVPAAFAGSRILNIGGEDYEFPYL